MSSNNVLLDIANLTVKYRAYGRNVLAVDNVCLTISAGEFLGLVGESGCGKSTVVKAILGLLPERQAIRTGSIRCKGQQLSKMNDSELSLVRCQQLGFIPQSPVAALNPVRTIGSQIREIYCLHMGKTKHKASAMSAAMLKKVRLNDVERVMQSYPHELSGGMCQRVVLAMALALNPSLLLADEPTTAVDASMRREIMEEIRREQLARNMGLLFISHDLRLVSRYADRLAVMYAGNIVEQGILSDILASPRHPYTRLLLGRTAVKQQTDVNNTLDAAGGCHFSPRCPQAVNRCHQTKPGWVGDELKGYACFGT